MGWDAVGLVIITRRKWGIKPTVLSLKESHKISVDKSVIEKIRNFF